jgi:hypothetical protein
MISGTKKRGSAAWFLTEQACCLAQADRRDTDDFHACKEAAEYLAGNDTEVMDEFLAHTGAVEPNPDADYDTEVYNGKDRDLAGALYTLLTLASDTETPERMRKTLENSAGLITAFYGADLELTA